MEVIEKIHSKLDQCSDALCYKICFLGIETLLQLSLAPGLNGGENERAHFQTKFHVYIDLVNKKCANLEPGFLKSWISYRVQLYYCRCLMIVNNMKQAKKEIKNALGIVQDVRMSKEVASLRGLSYFGCPFTPMERQNQFALNIKANLEYYRKNYSKALKLLDNCRAKDEKHAVSFNNNVGCIYFKLQRHHAALLYFRKALINDKPKMQEQNLINSYAADVTYNIGLSLLAADQAAVALKCFSACIECFPSRPHLWIRLAECYVRCYRTYSVHYFHTCRMESLSQGASKRIVLCPSRESSYEKRKNINECMSIAKNCIFKRLQLIQDYRSKEATYVISNENRNVDSDDHGNGYGNGSNGIKDENETGYDETISTLGLNVLEETCKVMQAYIAMELEDYTEGMSLCKNLISTSTLSEKNRFITEMMLCEALCQSGNTQEATAYLNPSVSSQNALSALSMSFDTSFGLHDVSESVQVAAIISLNRAIYLIHAGKLRVALPMLEELFKTIPTNQYVIKALLYCHIRCGLKPDHILKMLRSKQLF